VNQCVDHLAAEEVGHSDMDISGQVPVGQGEGLGQAGLIPDGEPFDADGGVAH